jgi:DNA/RNA-binding domain of Phe-tRNA-synthetase-like protein
MNIQIEPLIREKLPNLVLGGFVCNVNTHPSSPELQSLIAEELAKLSWHTPESIREIDMVKATKEAYRILGKDPNRYRPSAESLLRRVANGRGLYQLGNVVDVLNLVSVKTGYSICGYDFDNVMGNISLGIGEPEEPYIGIGKGDINIELLPVFRDELSAFGTPTSDSVRTMLSARTKRFLMIFVGFGNTEKLQSAISEAADLLGKHADATGFERFVIPSTHN